MFWEDEEAGTPGSRSGSGNTSAAAGGRCRCPALPPEQLTHPRYYPRSVGEGNEDVDQGPAAGAGQRRPQDLGPPESRSRRERKGGPEAGRLPFRTAQRKPAEQRPPPTGSRRALWEALPCL